MVMPRPRLGAGGRVGAEVQIRSASIANLTTYGTGQICIGKLCGIVSEMPKSCTLNVMNITSC